MPVREPRRKKRKRENQTSGGKNRIGAAPLLGHTAILKKNEKMKARRTIITHTWRRRRRRLPRVPAPYDDDGLTPGGKRERKERRMK